MEVASFILVWDSFKHVKPGEVKRIQKYEFSSLISDLNLYPSCLLQRLERQLQLDFKGFLNASWKKVTLPDLKQR